MKEPGLHLSLLPAGDGPHKSNQSCHWQESSSRTASPWCTTLPSVYTRDIQAWALQTPNGTIIQPLPCTAQTVGGKPISQYDGTRSSTETLFCSHAVAICKFAISNLHGEMGLPQSNPDYSLNGRYSVFKRLSECVMFDFVSNQQ